MVSHPLHARRIVVLMPNWLGDGVMATPFLRSLRGLYPDAHIAAVARPLVAPVLAGLSFVDETFITKKGEERAAVRFLKNGKFDLGISLPNSFRAAWMLYAARIKHRVGYARELRSMLLTHRLRPLKRSVERREADLRKEEAIDHIGGRHVTVGSPFQPVPTINYYLAIAHYLGAPAHAPRHMELAITDAERAEAEAILKALSLPLHAPLIVLVPGANFGASKCWLPDRFAAVTDHLVHSRNATVLLAGSPAELPIVEAIIAASKHPARLVPLAKHNASLGALKEIVRRAVLMVCNDTGPRHFAAALGTPVVTLFGPTDPTWAETFFPRERQVRIDVPCGPCQLKKCPIDHRCMKGITTPMVLQAVASLASDA